MQHSSRLGTHLRSSRQWDLMGLPTRWWPAGLRRTSQPTSVTSRHQNVVEAIAVPIQEERTMSGWNMQDRLCLGTRTSNTRPSKLAVHGLFIVGYCSNSVEKHMKWRMWPGLTIHGLWQYNTAKLNLMVHTNTTTPWINQLKTFVVQINISPNHGWFVRTNQFGKIVMAD